MAAECETSKHDFGPKANPATGRLIAAARIRVYQQDGEMVQERTCWRCGTIRTERRTVATGEAIGRPTYHYPGKEETEST